MNSETSNIGLSQIGQIAITVHDLDRAVAFYQQTLGLKLQFLVPKMAFFDCGGVRLMLAVPEKPEFDHPASVIYYKVADLPAAHAALGVSTKRQANTVICRNCIAPRRGYIIGT